MSDSAIPDDPREALVLDAEEHISGIMFDSLESPDPECVLCKAGIELGIWARWDVDDPFRDSDV